MAEEDFVDVGSSFPADGEALEAVQPGETALDDPPVGAQSGILARAAPGNGGHGPACADAVSVDVVVVVVSTVGEERVRLASGASHTSPHGWDRVEQGQQLGDIVAVAAGEDDRERSAVAVGDQVVLGAGPAPVARRRARRDPPLAP